MNDWNRYRVGRVIRLLVILAIIDLIVASLFDIAPANALIEAPSRLFDYLPLVVQLAFGFVFVIVQFVGLFWFLSRGGIDTYMPDDIDTRFTDVWGQDNVVERVKENIVFLEDPESIESKGGHVPSGILLWGPPGTGKTLMAEAVAGETGKPYVFVDPGAFAQPLTARVLTPSGWRKMGDLAVDDLVIGRDGRATRVNGVFPQGSKDIFRATFSDGASTRVTADHLWAVQTQWLRESKSSKWQVRRTADLGQLRKSHKGGWRYSIPVVSPVELDEQPVPLDPYVLGSQIAADRLDAYVERVPDVYMENSVDVRAALLHGLLSDTDAAFDTTSPGVCDDVVALVQSLGGTARATLCPEGAPEGRQRGTSRAQRYLVAISLPDGSEPVRRYITAIEPDGHEPAQCIRVDAEDHLYVTDDFIVTHNTAMFMGVGILKVKGLFRKLRKLALRYGGVIVFFDEADSLGSRGGLATGGPGQGMMREHPFAERAPDCNGLRYLTPESQHAIIRDGIVMGGMGMGGGGMGTLQALLSELSGLKKPRGFLNRHGRRVLGMKPKPPPKYRILVMMATNMPQALDDALLRPGRIDRIYKVGYPSKLGRIRTYNGYLAKVAHALTEEQVDRLATITPYATGATIKDLVNEALINAIRDKRDVIEWGDVVKAKQLKDLGPPEDVEYIERERHAVAIHEACHAVIAYRARHHLTIDIATIEKGGTYLGMVASIPPEDQFTRWRTEYEADIMVSLASLAGERMFFDGDNSSGVSGDLESATMIATLMEGYWGMGTTVASHGVTHRVGIGGGGKPGAPDPKDGDNKDMLSGTLGRRIESKLDELLHRVEEMLVDNRASVLAVAHALETNKTVTGEDIEAIIQGTRGPLVDGRMYHEPEFLELAERYHRDAVVAHVAHDKPVLELPKPAVWWHVDDEDEEPPYENGHVPIAVNAAEVAPDATEADDPRKRRRRRG
jgi:ATP-dependent Zn protease